MQEEGKAAQARFTGLENRNPGATMALVEQEGLSSPYVTTAAAAEYLCRSVSWLLRQNDIPYLPGNPNVYSKVDLDRWFESHKVELEV